MKNVIDFVFLFWANFSRVNRFYSFVCFGVFPRFSRFPRFPSISAAVVLAALQSPESSARTMMGSLWAIAMLADDYANNQAELGELGACEGECMLGGRLPSRET